jgi:stage II sporulation protein P
MFVVGTDAGSLSHPEWEENLSLALKLQILLERENPGICRNLNLTANRYNQHLGDYALLIEIGAAGNTLSQAALAAEELARAIIALKHGSN